MLEGGIDSDSSSFTNMNGNAMGGTGNAMGGGGSDMMNNAMQMDGMPQMGVDTSNAGGMGGQWNGADGFATQVDFRTCLHLLCIKFLLWQGFSLR